MVNITDIKEHVFLNLSYTVTQYCQAKNQTKKS